MARTKQTARKATGKAARKGKDKAMRKAEERKKSSILATPESVTSPKSRGDEGQKGKKKKKPDMSTNAETAVTPRPDNKDGGVEKLKLGGFDSKKDRKRKRAASPSGSDDPLALHGFELGSASKIKSEPHTDDELTSSLYVPETTSNRDRPIQKKLKIKTEDADEGALQATPEPKAPIAAKFPSIPKPNQNAGLPGLFLTGESSRKRAPKPAREVVSISSDSSSDSDDEEEEEEEEESAPLEALEKAILESSDVPPVQQQHKRRYSTCSNESDDVRSPRPASKKSRLVPCIKSPDPNVEAPNGTKKTVRFANYSSSESDDTSDEEGALGEDVVQARMAAPIAPRAMLQMGFGQGVAAPPFDSAPPPDNSSDSDDSSDADVTIQVEPDPNSTSTVDLPKSKGQLKRERKAQRLADAEALLKQRRSGPETKAQKEARKLLKKQRKKERDSAFKAAKAAKAIEAAKAAKVQKALSNPNIPTNNPKSKKQQKQERKEAAQAQAAQKSQADPSKQEKTKAQQKKERMKEKQNEQKSLGYDPHMQKQMRGWKTEAKKKHTKRLLKRLAVAKLGETQDLDVVKSSLQEVMQDIEQEAKKLEKGKKGAANNQDHEGPQDQTQGQPPVLQQVLQQIQPHDRPPVRSKGQKKEDGSKNRWTTAEKRERKSQEQPQDQNSEKVGKQGKKKGKKNQNTEVESDDEVEIKKEIKQEIKEEWED